MWIGMRKEISQDGGLGNQYDTLLYKCEEHLPTWYYG